MSRWDTGASAHLDKFAARLADAGVAALLEHQVARVFRRNADAFDHQEGDTPLCLGITCAENIRTLIVRASVGAESLWRAAGVSALSVDNSLQLGFRDSRLAVMKAPPSAGRNPHWDGSVFNWAQGDSGVRAEAAARNRRGYSPGASDQDSAELVIDGVEHPEGSVDQLRDFLLVWSGDLDTGLTAGWLGIPTLGPNYWYAVTNLWWHDAVPATGSSEGLTGATGDVGTYETQVVPEPLVRLKAPAAQRGTAKQ